MKYYNCYLNATNWKALVTHFKIFHLLKSEFVYNYFKFTIFQLNILFVRFLLKYGIH